MSDVTRRGAVKTLGASALLVAAADGAVAQQATLTAAPAFTGSFQPKALKFDPAKLPGLSERLMKSHWENNYQGSVKTLNAVRSRLSAALADKDAPPALYGGLKREEAHRTGSVVLHELYFDGLGGNGQAGGWIKQAIEAAYGSFATWEAEYRRTAMSLAGGSGWTILSYNLHTGTLGNSWSWDHMHAPAAGIPLLVLDMYEHSFHMDYGTQAAKYVDAWFANLDWEEVDRRYARAVASARG